MLHSYQVLSVVRLEQERRLERWHLVQAAREATPRAGKTRRFAKARGVDLGFLSRRLSGLRPAADVAVCC